MSSLPSASSVSSAPSVRTQLVAAIAVAAALGLAGCSSAGSFDADDYDGTTPSEDLAFDGSDSDDGGSGEDDGPDEDFVFEPPAPEPEQLSPEEIENFEMPPVPAPEQLLPKLENDRAESIAAAAATPGADILVAAAIEREPTKEEIESSGDGLPRTATGQLITLDEPASVACANIEMAIRSIDGGDNASAGERLAAAVALVSESTSEGVQAWMPHLEAEVSADTIDPVVLVGFLEACVAGGHEL